MGQKEELVYDGMNRLTNWDIYQNNVLVKQNSMVYNSTTGTITTKSDLDNLTMLYGDNGKPHALTGISGVPSNFPTDSLRVTYTDFKKIKTLTEGNNYYILTYGIDDQRRKSEYKINGITQKTKYYFGDYEEESDNVGNTRKIHYLSGGAILITTNGVETLYYGYSDYQGNLIALASDSGTVVERYAYDPWGKRRNPANWTLDDTRTSWIIDRGYTMHEHLDQFGIINMNGRVYDPLTAMFFSPDPFVQAPGNWLSYNRYSYVHNNPFRYVDPDGNNPLLIVAGIYLLFFTDTGYDIQKYLSPVAVHVKGGLGNERHFLGIEASFGVPQILPLSYRKHVGAAYYWRDYDNMYSGWETSYGAEWGAGVPGITATFSTTFYDREGEKFDQYRDLWRLGNPLFSLQAENDADMNILNLPWLPKHEASDKHMSSEVRLRLFGFIEIGNTTVTGESYPYAANGAGLDLFKYQNGEYTSYGDYNPDEFRAGILYMQIGFIRIGYNSETIRDKTQNRLHDMFGWPRFRDLKRPGKWYWEFYF
jgi:RHS repeat-associated protein